MSILKRLKMLLIITLATAFTLNIPGLCEEADARLQFFEGGTIDGTFLLRSTLLTGAGVNGAVMGMTAPWRPSSYVVFGNPAALGRLERRQFTIGFAPNIEINIPDVQDTAPTIEEEVDAALETFQRTGPVSYPVVTGIAGRAGSAVSGLALALPLDTKKDNWFGGIPRLFDVIAFGYHQPLYVHLKSIYSGLRMRLRTIDEQPSAEILFYSSIKMSADMKISADNWSVSGARKLDKFWLGFGLIRTDINVDLNGHLRTDGIMSKAGINSAFNDPNLSWHSDYTTDMNVNLGGSSLGTRIGLTYQPFDKLLLGTDVKLQSKATLDGPFNITMNQFKALKLTAGEGEKKFDVNEIAADELTRTIPKYFDVTSDMIVEIPQAFSVGATYGGLFSPHVAFTMYFGELAYSLHMVEDGAEFYYKRGFKPEWSGMLGLDVYIFKLAVGGMKMADVVDGYHDAAGVPIKTLDPTIIPHLSVGFDASVADNITLGVLLFGLPEDVLRFTLRFDF